jgi:hypothetical protein
MPLLSWFRRPRPLRRKERRLPLWMEALEARVVPAATTWTWIGVSGSNWNAPSAWTDNTGAHTAPPTNGTANLIFDSNNVSAGLTTNNNLANASFLSVKFAGPKGFNVTGNGFAAQTIVVANTDAASLDVINTTSAVFLPATLTTINATVATGKLVISGAGINLSDRVLTLTGLGEVDVTGPVARGGNGGQINSNINTAVINGVISGGSGGTAVNMTKGAVTLGGANTFLGAVTELGGTLTGTNAAAFGSAVAVTGGATVILSLLEGSTLPGTLQFNYSKGGGSVGGGVLRNGNGTNITIAAVFSTEQGPLTIDGPKGGSFTFTRGIGTSGITQANRSTLNLTGTGFTVNMKNSGAGGNNDGNYIGNITVASGVALTLGFNGPANNVAVPANLIANGKVDFLAGTANNQIAGTSTVTLNRGGVLSLNGTSETIAALVNTNSAGGVVQLGGGTLTISNAAADTFDGTFAGSGGLNKTGAGVLTLTGNSGAGFTASNAVQQGTEIVNGSLGGGTTSVAAGAILAGGNGTTAGTVGTLNSTGTNASKATVNPGPVSTTATGILKAGNVTLDANTVFKVLVSPASTVAAPVPGTNYDQLNATGAVNLGGAALSLATAAGFGAKVGRVYSIITGSSITGTLSLNGTTLNSGDQIRLATGTFEINYTPTAVTLTEKAVPTTTTLVISPTTSVYGQAVTFTATVKTTTGQLVPNGTVEIKIGGSLRGSGPVNNGVAVISINKLTPFVYTNLVVASYTGVTQFLPSDSATGSLTVNKANTTTVLSPLTSTITFGQTATLTATVTAASPSVGGVAPTGTVQFTVTPTPVGGQPAPITLTAGVGPSATATLNLPNLTPGTYTVTATYSNDTNYNGSSTTPTTGSAKITVNKAAPSSPTLTVGSPSQMVGAAGTYTFSMAVPTSTAPTGSVTFTAKLGSNPAISLGAPVTSFTLTGGVYQAVLPNAGQLLGVGTYTITATYSGDNNYSGTSAMAPQTITQGKATLAITTFNPTFTFGTPQSYTITVTVPDAGAPAPKGSLKLVADPNGANIPLGQPSATFTRIGNTNQYTVTISNAVTTGLTVGDHIIQATLNADPNYTATPSTVTQTVTKALPTISAPTITTNPSVFGQSNTYKATLTIPTGLPAPTGTITFTATSTTTSMSFPLGSAPISGTEPFTATLNFTGTPLAPDAYNVTATYSGDGNYSTVTSAPTTQTVNKANTSAHVTAGSSSYVIGSVGTVTATVSVTAPGSGAQVPPTGSILFTFTPTVGSAVTQPQMIIGGTATADLSKLPGGSYAITAKYQGDGNFNISAVSSPAVNVTITPATTSGTLTISPSTSSVGQSVQYLFTMTVPASASAIADPTGLVTFKATAGPNTPLTLGTGSFTKINATTYQATFTGGNSLVAGSYTITASYAGDSNYKPTSGTAPQTVTAVSAPIAITAYTPAISYASLPQSYTVTVTVPTPASPAPTGTMTITFDGNTLVSGNTPYVHVGATNQYTITLFNNSVVMPAGSHSLVATLTGDPNYSGTSNVATQVVNQVTPTVSITSISPNSTVVFGQLPLTVNITVGTPAAGVAPTAPLFVVAVNTSTHTPTVLGSTSTYMGGGGLFTASVTYTGPALPVGSYDVTATFSSGDTNYATANSSPASLVVNQALTTTTVNAGTTPIPYGSTGSVTATVAVTTPGAGTPTGSVKFFFTGGATQTVPLIGLTASPDLSTFLPGTYTIQAQYLGDTSFSASSGNSVQVTISPAATSGALTITPSTSTLGSNVTYNFNLTVPASLAAKVPPTGQNVTFTAITGPGTPINLGTAALVATGSVNVFQASLQAGQTLPVGSFTIQASYAGDTNYAPASDTQSQTVTAVAVPIVISGFSPTIPYGILPQSYTVTVTVPTPTSPAPTGTMSIHDDVFDLNIVSGSTYTQVGATNQYTITLTQTTNPALLGGNHSLTATLTGDPNYTGTSSAVTQVVSKGTPVFTVTNISPNSTTVFGELPFTYTIRVDTPPFGLAPSKPVTLTATNLSTGTPITLGSTSVYSGASTPFTATITYNGPALPVGSYVLAASFPGDTNYVSTFTTAGNQVVNQAATTTSVDAGVQPIPFGTPGSVTATVAVTSPGAGTPTGNVEFFIPGADPQVVPLNNTLTASPDLSALLPGTYNITAQYLGDTSFMTSGGNVSVTIAQAATSAVIFSITPSPSTVGSEVTFVVQFTVPTVAANVIEPTGLIDLGTTVNAVPVDLGSTTEFTLVSSSGGNNVYQATVVSTVAQTLPAGSYTIDAIYSGDTNYEPANAPSQTLMVSPATPTAVVSFLSSPIEFGNLPQSYIAILTVPNSTNPPTPTGVMSLILDGTTTLTSSGAFINLGGGQYQVILIYNGPALTVGTHAITTSYSGDSNYNSVTSAAVPQVVTPASVFLSFPGSAVNPDPTNVGDLPVTYTVNVQAQVSAGVPGPTAMVDFTALNTQTLAVTDLGTAPLVGGPNAYTATLTYNGPPLSAGTYQITATYLGDPNYAVSKTDTPASQTILKLTPTFAFDAGNPVTPNPQPYNTFPVTYSLVVTSPSATAPAPTGSVTVTTVVGVKTVTLGTSSTFTPLGGGAYSVTVISNSPALQPGTYTVTAAYSGDVNYTTPAAVTTTQTVIGAPVMRIAYTSPPKVLTVGTTTVLNILVSNIGNAADTNGVFITQTLPANTVFVPGSSTPGWTQIAPGLFRLNLSANFAAGAKVNVRFAVATPKTAPVNRAVTATASVFDSLSNNALWSATLNLVIAANLRWPTF